MYGVVFGVLFPLVAWAFELLSRSLPFTLESLAYIHSQNTMLYMIDTAPFFLGLVAHIAGRYKISTDNYRRKLESLIQNLEGLVSQRTEELEKANANLQQSYLKANAFALAQRAFLANMSHEIRTPMNAIIGMATIAQKHLGKPESSEKVERSTQQILTSSRHLLGLINNILDLSKIEAGEFTLTAEDFALEDLVAECSQIITPRCAEKQITLKTTLAGVDGLWLKSDKLRLMQVLINLLGNAIKFTPPTGSITLRITAEERTASSVRLSFAVEDTGIGMSAETIAVLFQPFKQGNDKEVRKAGGTGLGLSISQNIVSLLGGTIQATSTLGTGSSFFFTLTLDVVSPHVQAEEAPLVVTKLTGRRILLVDDVEVNRIIVAELLEETNVGLGMASDGHIGVEMFKQSPPGYYDLILMDVQMPTMDGYTATRTLRALDRPDAATIPIIAMTANAMREDAQRAAEAGMNNHIAKPIDWPTLIRMLNHYLAPPSNE